MCVTTPAQLRPSHADKRLGSHRNPDAMFRNIRPWESSREESQRVATKTSQGFWAQCLQKSTSPANAAANGHGHSPSAKPPSLGPNPGVLVNTVSLESSPTDLRTCCLGPPSRQRPSSAAVTKTARPRTPEHSLCGPLRKGCQTQL